MKTFRPDLVVSEGAAAVDKYHQLRRSGLPWEYEVKVEVILPFETWVTQQVLHETEHYELWLSGESGGSVCLPERFGLGQLLYVPQRFNMVEPSFLVDYEHKAHEQRTTLVIQRSFYQEYPAYYYRMMVEPHERLKTRFSMHVFSSKKKETGFMSIFRIDPTYENSASVRELTDHLRASLKHFEQLCYDRLTYGPPYLESQAKARWEVWRYGDGRLHYFPGRGGGLGPVIGEFIAHGEAVGFVCPTGKESELQRYKQDAPIRPWPGFVREIRMNHGAQITTLDRVILTSEEPHSDLSEALVTIKNSHGDPRLSESKLASYAVPEGAWVKQGEVIACLKDYRGNILELKSNFEGQLLEHLCKVGEAASEVAILRLAPLSPSRSRP